MDHVHPSIEDSRSDSRRMCCENIERFSALPVSVVGRAPRNRRAAMRNRDTPTLTDW